MGNEPMNLAVRTLSALCDQIDAASGDSLDESLQQAFSDARMHLKEEVQYRILFDIWAKSQLKAAQEAYRYFRSRAERIEEVHQAFKERTRDAMLIKPDFEYRCELGKVSLVENPQGVDYTFGERKLDEGTIDFFGIPASYVKAKVTYEIDHEKVKADLAAGVDLAFAKPADKKYHVRFPAQRKPKKIEGNEE